MVWDNPKYIPQALSTGLVQRIKKNPENSLIKSFVPTTRHRRQVNYSEFGNDDDDDDEFNGNTPQRGGAGANTDSNGHAQQDIIVPKPYKMPRYSIDKLNQFGGITITTDEELLLPIKLEISYNNDNSTYHDTFIWNAGQDIVLPAEFAKILGGDLELPTSAISLIEESMNKQIEEYRTTASASLPAGREYHVVINLSVSLGNQYFEDRFEWDLGQTTVSPETFADIIVADLGLSVEFRPLIAAALHETVLRLKREIIFDNKNYEVEKYQQLSGLLFERNIRISTESSVSNGNDRWEPVIEILTPEEISRREVERQRSSRRKNRENLKGHTKRRHDDDGWRF